MPLRAARATKGKARPIISRPAPPSQIGWVLDVIKIILISYIVYDRDNNDIKLVLICFSGVKKTHRFIKKPVATYTARGEGAAPYRIWPT